MASPESTLGRGRGDPSGSVPPTCPGGLESEGKDSPLPLEGLFLQAQQGPPPQLDLIGRNKHHQGHV